MIFLNREEELERLDQLAARDQGGMVVLYGRRRIGKTRILLEWVHRHAGLYTVADQSSSDIQLRYAAEAIATRFPGFADVDYRDWTGLLTRLAREAKAEKWRGPIVFDEFPYLVLSSPELPSVLQRWIDHEAREAKLLVAVAGSSQRMMQGLVLPSNAPLFGRASEILAVPPLEPHLLCAAVGARTATEVVEAYAAWGGVPRYWELASGLKGTILSKIEKLVLDPRGPLHREPDRMLIEELPTAMEVRPVLDAIGAGAHRVSEIASRVGRPATSMSRPLDRLLEMGLVRREIPFGESERKSRRSLYKIADPFFRLWFRVVAPNRGYLANNTVEGRTQLLRRYWENLVAEIWEDLCRTRLPFLPSKRGLGKKGPWAAGSRWWRGQEGEWDVVSQSLDAETILLGEAKWSKKPFSRDRLRKEASRLLSKAPPGIPSHLATKEPIRVLFIPEIAEASSQWRGEVRIVSASDLLEL